MTTRSALCVTLLLAACGRSFVYEPQPPRRNGGGAGGTAGGSQEPTVMGQLRLAVDDFYRLYVNGKLVKDNQTEQWTMPQSFTLQLPCGANTLALVARNQWEVDGFDRGVAVDLSTPSLRVVSDSTWRLTSGDQPFADASAWPAAFDEGPHGMSPWGAVFGTSNARWLWSYDSNVPTSAKPELETVTLKKTFTLDCP